MLLVKGNHVLAQHLPLVDRFVKSTVHASTVEVGAKLIACINTMGRN